MHRLAFIVWWATSASLAGLSLSSCRHYENITDIYTDPPPPPDAAPGGRGGAGGSGGRPPPGPIAGESGQAGTGGSEGSAGSGGAAGTPGSGGAGGIQVPLPDASAPAPDTVSAPVDSAPPAPPPDAPVASSTTLGMGLISRWKLDESAATVLDSGGNGNLGVVSGATWEAGGFPGARYSNGGALRFDGVDDFVELGARNLPANNRAQSVSFWLRFDAVPPAVGRFVCLSLTAGTMGSSRLKLGFKEGQIGAWRSGTPGDLAVAAPPAPGWHHLVYTFDGTTHRLFLDGTQRATSTAAADTGAVFRARLGSNFDNSERFTGLVDEVRVYGRALTAEEVAALNAGFE